MAAKAHLPSRQNRWGKLIRLCIFWSSRIFANKKRAGMLLVCAVALLMYWLNLSWMKSFPQSGGDRLSIDNTVTAQPLIFPVAGSYLAPDRPAPDVSLMDNDRRSGRHADARALKKAQADVARRQMALDRARLNYLRLRRQLAQADLSGEYAETARDRVEAAAAALEDASARLDQIRNAQDRQQHDPIAAQASISNLN